MQIGGGGGASAGSRRCPSRDGRSSLAAPLPSVRSHTLARHDGARGGAREPGLGTRSTPPPSPCFPSVLPLPHSPLPSLALREHGMWGEGGRGGGRRGGKGRGARAIMRSRAHAVSLEGDGGEKRGMSLGARYATLQRTERTAVRQYAM
ncbi:uncharacterized protein SCHCODRAFT_02620210 [Schizophyllum commune H4-8]|uniref:uncharacterized protein n=1 Tax=Schizophyllum commune (strain H4-8 / FGSC 9210) TaxID=578458 RepID=UPI00215EACC7|nr:uncharacterized protein SCHCODRAFT_02620210 [Schizophyllum commune H4-8]KAI5895733.1 hypothetical protein SCHCODRAFT_02620210 [Schizophyllum commune H4-8]